MTSAEKKLGERDRKFFALVARATFANPFSAERAALDAEIGDTDASDPHVLARASARLDARLAALAESGVALSELFASDRELLFAALLFGAFHRYIGEIDALIESPARVRFARPLLAELHASGLGEAVAKRALELFYQMRRAHLAIGRRLVGGGASMRRLREQLWNLSLIHI